MIKITSWNVNSIRMRLPNLLAYIEKFQPDIMLLQETKCQDAQFPFEALEDCGFNIMHHGQKKL